ncbi:MAG: hypothetical protein DHS80DRAFT_20755 [Piptocephalis tieghemiana]|nr:MAG: hypothetical protein DHS80DRAFT_20755 [Piptocephalis tieghemiana]
MALGLGIMTLSALFFSLQSFFVSYGGRRLLLPSALLILARSVGQSILALGLAKCLDASVLGPREVRGWLVLRGSLGALGLAGFFYSLTHLPLADATVVFFTGPAFTSIFAHLILAEPFSTLDKVAAAICLFGVTLVAKPSFLFPSPSSSLPEDQPILSDAEEWNRLLAVAGALFGAILAALAYTTVRKVGSRAHFLAHTFYFGIASSIISLALLFLFPSSPSSPSSSSPLLSPFLPLFDLKPIGWLLLAGIGFAAFLGQCCLNRGLQLAPAGPGSLMRNLDVVFAYLFGLGLLGDPVDLYGILGALLIIGTTISVGLYKWLRVIPSSPTRSRGA